MMVVRMLIKIRRVTMNYDDDGGGEDQDVQVPTSIQSS